MSVLLTPPLSNVTNSCIDDMLAGEVRHVPGVANIYAVMLVRAPCKQSICTGVCITMAVVDIIW